MELFDKTIHDFGEVAFNTTHKVVFKYLGTEVLNPRKMSVPCGCTTPIYNKETKELIVTLNMNTHGEKNSYVTIRTDNEGVVTLRLKALVK